MSTPDNNEIDHRRLVVLAIDNNAQAWYEMVIPFIVSLRATDYRGRIGVIGYGLSPEKQQRLLTNGIEVFAPTEASKLAWDRYLSAADIMATSPELDSLALYDADIWFPGPHFDLFDLLPDDGCVHVAPDAIFCTFVTTPIIGERKDALEQQCAQDVISHLGHALQAGLIAGGRAAWVGFGQHVREQISRIGQDFQPIYGLDTTFLHLWAGLGHVRLLGCEQNFVTKWGLHERHDLGTGHVSLEHRGTPIRGLHMTGDVRFLNRWRYLARDAERALAHGQAFALASESAIQGQPAELEMLQTERFAAMGLTLVGTHEDLLTNVPRLAAGVSFRNPKGCALNAWTSHRLEFTVTRERAVIDIYLSHLNGQPSAPSVKVEINNGVHALQPPLGLAFEAKQGDRVTLSALTLPGQTCHTAWDIVVRDA